MEYPQKQLGRCVNYLKLLKGHQFSNIHQLSKFLGFKSTHGGASALIHSMIKFGLLDLSFNITSLGYRIINEEKEENLREALLTPNLFRIFDQTFGENVSKRTLLTRAVELGLTPLFSAPIASACYFNSLRWVKRLNPIIENRIYRKIDTEIGTITLAYPKIADREYILDQLTKHL